MSYRTVPARAASRHAEPSSPLAGPVMERRKSISGLHGKKLKNRILEIAKSPVNRRSAEDLKLMSSYLVSLELEQFNKEVTKDPNVLEELCNKVTYLHVPGERILFRQGAVADKLYVVIRGAVSIWLYEGGNAEDLMDETKREQLIREDNVYKSKFLAIKRGGHSRCAFGEVGLLRDCRRTASVRIEEDSEMLVITRADFTKIKNSLVSNSIERNACIRAFPCFRNVKQSVVRKLGSVMRILWVPPRHAIFRASERASHIYFVLAGRAQVLHDLRDHEVRPAPPPVNRVRVSATRHLQDLPAVRDSDELYDVASPTHTQMLNSPQRVNAGGIHDIPDTGSLGEINTPRSVATLPARFDGSTVSSPDIDQTGVSQASSPVYEGGSGDMHMHMDEEELQPTATLRELLENTESQRSSAHNGSPTHQDGTQRDAALVSVQVTSPRKRRAARHVSFSDARSMIKESFAQSTTEPADTNGGRTKSRSSVSDLEELRRKSSSTSPEPVEEVRVPSQAPRSVDDFKSSRPVSGRRSMLSRRWAPAALSNGDEDRMLREIHPQLSVEELGKRACFRPDMGDDQTVVSAADNEALTMADPLAEDEENDGLPNAARILREKQRGKHEGKVGLGDQAQKPHFRRVGEPVPLYLPSANFIAALNASAAERATVAERGPSLVDVMNADDPGVGKPLLAPVAIRERKMAKSVPVSSSYTQTRLTLTHVKPGDVIGDCGVMDPQFDRKYPFSVVTQSRCCVVVWEVSQFMKRVPLDVTRALQSAAQTKASLRLAQVEATRGLSRRRVTFHNDRMSSDGGGGSRRKSASLNVLGSNTANRSPQKPTSQKGYPIRVLPTASMSTEYALRQMTGHPNTGEASAIMASVVGLPLEFVKFESVASQRERIREVTAATRLFHRLARYRKKLADATAAQSELMETHRRRLEQLREKTEQSLSFLQRVRQQLERQDSEERQRGSDLQRRRIFCTHGKNGVNGSILWRGAHTNAADEHSGNERHTRHGARMLSMGRTMEDDEGALMRLSDRIRHEAVALHEPVEGYSAHTTQHNTASPGRSQHQGAVPGPGASSKPDSHVTALMDEYDRKVQLRKGFRNKTHPSQASPAAQRWNVSMRSSGTGVDTHLRSVTGEKLPFAGDHSVIHAVNVVKRKQAAYEWRRRQRIAEEKAKNDDSGPVRLSGFSPSMLQDDGKQDERSLDKAQLMQQLKPQNTLTSPRLPTRKVRLSHVDDLVDQDQRNAQEADDSGLRISVDEEDGKNNNNATTAAGGKDLRSPRSPKASIIRRLLDWGRELSNEELLEHSRALASANQGEHVALTEDGRLRRINVDPDSYKLSFPAPKSIADRVKAEIYGLNLNERIKLAAGKAGGGARLQDAVADSDTSGDSREKKHGETGLSFRHRLTFVEQEEKMRARRQHKWLEQHQVTHDKVRQRLLRERSRFLSRRHAMQWMKTSTLGDVLLQLESEIAVLEHGISSDGLASSSGGEVNPDNQHKQHDSHTLCPKSNAVNAVDSGDGWSVDRSRLWLTMLSSGGGRGGVSKRANLLDFVPEGVTEGFNAGVGARQAAYSADGASINTAHTSSSSSKSGTTGPKNADELRLWIGLCGPLSAMSRQLQMELVSLAEILSEMHDQDGHIMMRSGSLDTIGTHHAEDKTKKAAFHVKSAYSAGLMELPKSALGPLTYLDDDSAGSPADNNNNTPSLQPQKDVLDSVLDELAKLEEERLTAKRMGKVAPARAAMLSADASRYVKKMKESRVRRKRHNRRRMLTNLQRIEHRRARFFGSQYSKSLTTTELPLKGEHQRSMHSGPRYLEEAYRGIFAGSKAAKARRVAKIMAKEELDGVSWRYLVHKVGAQKAGRMVVKPQLKGNFADAQDSLRSVLSEIQLSKSH